MKISIIQPLSIEKNSVKHCKVCKQISAKLSYTHWNHGEDIELHQSCKYQEFTEDTTIIFGISIPKLQSELILIVRERIIVSKLKILCKRGNTPNQYVIANKY